jgi:NOL1/NOP2/fmu family ribosome biogenesis protein
MTKPQIDPYPLSHPAGAAEKVRQLTRIRTRKLRVQYTNNSFEVKVMRKGVHVATLKKERYQGFKDVWTAYSLSGKNMGSFELHKIKDLLNHIKSMV